MRHRLELPDADTLRTYADDSGRLAVRVTPGARSEGVDLINGRVLLKVRPKPEDGKATVAAINLLSQALGVAPSRIGLLRGATSREKLFQIPTQD